jgi:hypothetical protein
VRGDDDTLETDAVPSNVETMICDRLDLFGHQKPTCAELESSAYAVSRAIP